MITTPTPATGTDAVGGSVDERPAPVSPSVLTVDEHVLELPRAHATQGSDGLGISKLLGTTGLVTLDPGFTNTAACTSDITYIDGDAGILRYRGYPIEELAKSSDFLEVAQLLITGELPDRESFERLDRRIKRHRLLHEDFRTFFTAFPSDGHPMAILQAGIAGLATYYQDTLNPHDPYEREWKFGNSRWDLLDALRLMHALRPEGIVWRQREDGKGTSYKLEHLAEDNHLRIGEGILVAKDLQVDWGIHDMDYLRMDCMTLRAQIVEVKDKPTHPVGPIMVDCFCNRPTYEDRGIRRRAIAGIGRADVGDVMMLRPRTPGMTVVGGSSDHCILDVEDCHPCPRVGDVVDFDVIYLTMLYASAREDVPVVFVD